MGEEEKNEPKETAPLDEDVNRHSGLLEDD